MTGIFHRTDLAREMARQLINPGVMDEGLRTGLFLSGLRRIGKTTFLTNDLIPALEEAGALVIYVDLWSNTRASPASQVLAAVKKTLTELTTTGSNILTGLKRNTGADMGIAAFKLGFKLDTLGQEGGPSLAQALMEVVDQARTNVALIVDAVQLAITSEASKKMLLALKAARDAINSRPDTPGHFILIGTGSLCAMVTEMAARKNPAFVGATSISYPVLGRDYVVHLLNRLAQEGAMAQPSIDVAERAFATLGSRPEELQRALRQLNLHLPAGGNPDEHLPVIAATLRSTAADLELRKVQSMGGLAIAIFERIAAAQGDARGVFSTEAAGEYSKAIGQKVRLAEIQPVVNELRAANLIMRKGHGIYALADPFFQEVWRERSSLLT